MIALLALAENRCRLLQLLVRALLCACCLLEFQRRMFELSGARIFPQEGIAKDLQQLPIHTYALL